MILELLLNILPAVFIGITAYITYSLGRLLKYGDTGALQDLYFFLERTPALDSFLTIILNCAFIAAIVFCSLRQISNHIILSLDILYFISTLLLMLYHVLEESAYPLIKEA